MLFILFSGYPCPTEVNGTRVQKASDKWKSTSPLSNVYPARGECIKFDYKYCPRLINGSIHDSRCSCGANNLVECNFLGSARNTLFIYNGKFEAKCSKDIDFNRPNRISRQSRNQVFAGAVKASNTDTKDYLSSDMLYVVIGCVGFVVLAALVVNLIFRCRRKNTVKNTTMRLEQITVTR